MICLSEVHLHTVSVRDLLLLQQVFYARIYLLLICLIYLIATCFVSRRLSQRIIDCLRGESHILQVIDSLAMQLGDALVESFGLR